jgi:hypothetical protein
MGPIAVVERSPLSASGLSSSSLERLTLIRPDGGRRDLILKTVVPTESWTAYRSGDRIGREALVLAEPVLAPVWEVITCPYLAYAVEPARIGLLMDDLGAYLQPAERRLSPEREDAFLHGLAALHARFWQSDSIDLSWLAPLSVRFSILAPGAADEELCRHPDHPLFRAVERGWELTLARVPPIVRRLLLLPAEEAASHYHYLPQTLLHGDAKTGNCAFLPDGKITVFDWATPGPGPATLDLYYFLAVDARRQVSSKEAIIATYRRHLEVELGRTLPESIWDAMRHAGIHGAARMLLWSKALALERSDPGARADWDWWIERLSARPLFDHHL